jgi:sugar phosphate isomerase/epimerase
MFTASTPAARAEAIADNLRAVDEAAALGADLLVMVCGPVVDKDVAGSALMVRDGLEAVLPHAQAAGVALGIEPLHPMMAADRSVVARVADAAELVEALGHPDGLSVVVDAYHVWWDLHLAADLTRISGRVSGLHVSDWVSPLSGGLTSGRGMMGDGCIDLPTVAAQVTAAGWSGPVEVEVLSEWWWARPPEEVLATVVDRFRRCV